MLYNTASYPVAYLLAYATALHLNLTPGKDWQKIVAVLDKTSLLDRVMIFGSLIT